MPGPSASAAPGLRVTVGGLTSLGRTGECQGYPATLQAAEKTLRRLNIYEPDPLIYQG